MAIRIRRGNKIDFDPNKMVAGELGLALDSGELYFCYSPGNVKRLQTAEDLQNLLNASPDAYTALQQLVDDLKTNPNELANILSNISNLNTNKLDKTGNSKDNIVTFVEAGSDTDIVSGETHATIFGKILKTIKVLRENITKKIDKTSIVNNDTSGGTDKVASAEVVKVHGQEIDDLASEVTAINNNLANIFIAGNTILPNIDDSNLPYSVHRTSTSTIGTFPTGFSKVGALIPIKIIDFYKLQIFIDVAGKLAIRPCTDGVFGNWEIK